MGGKRGPQEAVEPGNCDSALRRLRVSPNFFSTAAEADGEVVVDDLRFPI